MTTKTKKRKAREWYIVPFGPCGLQMFTTLTMAKRYDDYNCDQGKGIIKVREVLPKRRKK